MNSGIVYLNFRILAILTMWRMQPPPKLDAPLFPDDMDKGMGVAAAAADNHTDMF
jgi:hypothetical protein